jgi:hypothetical protein
LGIENQLWACSSFFSPFLAVYAQIKKLICASAIAGGAERGFRCALCGFESRYSSNVRSHVEGQHHAEGLTYACLYCSYAVNTWQTLLLHMRKLHSHRRVR